MIRLKSIQLSESGRRVDYRYECHGAATRYLGGCEPFFVRYDVDVSGCPESLLAVPFVTNFEPIGWFAKFDVHVPSLDRAFHDSRPETRRIFSQMYPGEVGDHGVRAARLEDNVSTGNSSLMLFSGGLDAYATLIRHLDESPTLVVIHGADIDLGDHEQWDSCLEHVARSPLCAGLPRRLVASNLRAFYNEEVDARLHYGWWGGVQHGHALLGLLAPLAHVAGARLCHIAGGSTNPRWGSTKGSDESLRWARTSCRYDAHGMGRTEKAALVADAAGRLGVPLPLRVCYSETRRVGNCGRCEKCHRTIMNLVVAGADPRDFGLPMDGSTYPRLMRSMLRYRAGSGVALCWREISEGLRAGAARNWEKVFLLGEPEDELDYLRRIAAGDIDIALERNRSAWREHAARLKFILRVRCPGTYRFLRSLARLSRR